MASRAYTIFIKPSGYIWFFEHFSMWRLARWSYPQQYLYDGQMTGRGSVCSVECSVLCISKFDRFHFSFSTLTFSYEYYTISAIYTWPTRVNIMRKRVSLSSAGCLNSLCISITVHLGLWLEYKDEEAGLLFPFVSIVTNSTHSCLFEPTIPFDLTSHQTQR